MSFLPCFAQCDQTYGARASEFYSDNGHRWLSLSWFHLFHYVRELCSRLGDYAMGWGGDVTSVRYSAQKSVTNRNDRGSDGSLWWSEIKSLTKQCGIMLYSIGTLVEGRLREKETGKKKDAHILSPSLFPASPFPHCQPGSKHQKATTTKKIRNGWDVGRGVRCRGWRRCQADTHVTACPHASTQGLLLVCPPS